MTTQMTLFRACRERDNMNRRMRYQDMPFKIIRIKNDGAPYKNENFDQWNAFQTLEEAEKRIKELRSLNPHAKFELKY